MTLSHRSLMDPLVHCLPAHHQPRNTPHPPMRPTPHTHTHTHTHARAHTHTERAHAARAHARARARGANPCHAAAFRRPTCLTRPPLHRTIQQTVRGLGLGAAGMSGVHKAEFAIAMLLSLGMGPWRCGAPPPPTCAVPSGTFSVGLRRSAAAPTEVGYPPTDRSPSNRSHVPSNRRRLPSNGHGGGLRLTTQHRRGGPHPPRSEPPLTLLGLSWARNSIGTAPNGKNRHQPGQRQELVFVFGAEGYVETPDAPSGPLATRFRPDGHQTRHRHPLDLCVVGGGVFVVGCVGHHPRYRKAPSHMTFPVLMA